MVSRPKFPLELEASEMNPELSIPLLRLLPLPFDLLVCFLSGSNLLTCSNMYVRLNAAGPLRALWFSAPCLPKERWVGAAICRVAGVSR